MLNTLYGVIPHPREELPKKREPTVETFSRFSYRVFMIPSATGLLSRFIRRRYTIFCAASFAASAADGEPQFSTLNSQIFLFPLFVPQELLEDVVSQSRAVEGEGEAAVFLFQEFLFFQHGDFIAVPIADILSIAAGLVGLLKAFSPGEGGGGRCFPFALFLRVFPPLRQRVVGELAFFLMT